jgi:putative SOS response-associated peptidase YedK
MGIVGLWAAWKSMKGDYMQLFTMLTIHADAYGLRRQFHKPTDEKRMVVILPESRYSEWLGVMAGGEGEFLVPYPEGLLVAESGPVKTVTARVARCFAHPRHVVRSSLDIPRFLSFGIMFPKRNP